MGSMGKRLYVYQYPDAGTGGTGGAGGQGAAGGQGGGQGGQGQGGAQTFADATAARGFLKEYVNDEGVLTAVPDDKVVGWATHVKGKVDQLGTQFPANWRDQVAAGNAEHLKTLERFASPKAMYDAYGALRQKLSSGELKPVTQFPDKGTPEEQAAWRVTNGIPENAEGYGKALKFEGIELTDDDKGVIKGYSEAAFAKHVPPAAVQATLDWYFSEKTARAEARAMKDEEFKIASEDQLRADWGPDYRPNVARINALLDGAPKGVKEAFLGARNAEGKMLANDSVTLQWLVDLARQTNPAGVVLPGQGGTMAQSVDDEIKTIETYMRENRTAYNKDEKKQARLRDLYTARDQLATRKAA